MKHTTISARSNPWVQQWLRWQGKAGERKAAGVVWLEGEHLVNEALARSSAAGTQAAQLSVLEIVLPDTAQAKEVLAALLSGEIRAEAFPNVRVVYLSPSIYAQLCSVNSSPSVCCVIQLRSTAALDFSRAAVVLDGVQDPGNVGSVVRLCAAFGVPQLLLSAGCASAWGAKALRAGQGAQLAVTIAEDVDLSTAYAAFSAQQLPIAATSLQAGSVPLNQLKFNQASPPYVWVFGHEGQGIGEVTQRSATVWVNIPMQGGFESLNVASAAAICLWHWSNH